MPKKFSWLVVVVAAVVVVVVELVVDADVARVVGCGEVVGGAVVCTVVDEGIADELAGWAPPPTAALYLAATNSPVMVALPGPK